MIHIAVWTTIPTATHITPFLKDTNLDPKQKLQLLLDNEASKRDVEKSCRVLSNQ